MNIAENEAETGLLEKPIVEAMNFNIKRSSDPITEGFDKYIRKNVLKIISSEKIEEILDQI